ncbi:DUF3768 domain-containing protein [bacterium]|nr:DUF3768 domain-containing protein [bacterium]MBY0510192.1 DUF3768 domain-containing protein [Rhodospirillaceae bacterium]
MNGTESKADKIRELNDQLRTTFTGGQVVITRGIQSLGESVRTEIMAAISQFDAWSEDVDPHGEHDFVAVEVRGHKVFAKVDYYDIEMKFLSPDPTDPEVTRRVLTIMLAEEY